MCRCDGMVDVADSKSAGGDTVWVRAPPPVPRKNSIALRGLMLFFLFYEELGLEGSGSEWSAGGAPEPRPGSPAGEEPHHRYQISNAPTRGVLLISCLWGSNPMALGKALGALCNPRRPAAHGKSSPTASEGANAVTFPSCGENCTTLAPSSFPNQTRLRLGFD